MNRIVRFIFHVFAVVVVGCAVLLNFARIIVPQLSHHIPFYESWVSQALHEPVKIHDVKAYWNGFGPEMYFNQVVVYKKENHKPLIKIQHLAMGVNVWLSLFEWRLVPMKLSIAGTHIDVYQNKRGQLQITGMPKLENNKHRYKDTLTNLLFWLFTEADVQVNHVDLSFHNVRGINVELQNVQMRITNTLKQHHLSATANIRQKQPAKIQLITYLQGESLQDKHLQAKTYIRLQHIVTPVAKGDVQAWLQFRRKNKGWWVHADYVKGNVQLPMLNDHPVTLKKLAGDLYWQPLAQGWSLSSPSFYWTDGNMQQRSMFYIAKQAQHPFTFHLLSRFQVNNIALIRDYVPKQGIKPTLSQWLRTAILSGSIPEGELLVDGAHEQLFAQVKQASLKFNALWPVITNGDATLIFNDRRMQINSNKATMAGVPISHVAVEIPDLVRPRLLINGQARGLMHQGKYFLAQTPLNFAQDFNHVDLSGLFHLWLHLNVCLYCHNLSVHTQGLLRFKDVGLSLPRWHIPLTQINGVMTFTDKDLMSKNLQGFLFKQPLRIRVSTELQPHDQSTVQVMLTSYLGGKEFSQVLPAVKSYIQGESLFHVLLQLHDDASPLGNTIILESHLTGIAVTHLPPSLLKPASEGVLSRIKINFKNQKPTLLAVHYAKRLSLLAQLKQHHWHVSVTSDLIAGRLIVSQDFLTTWQGNLQRLYIPQLKQPASLPWMQRMTQLPSVNLSIADLHYGDMALGSLSLVTKNQAQQLLIKYLRLRLPNQYDLNLEGSWHYMKPVSTNVSGWVMSDNFANLLNQLGYPKTLSGGNGYVQGVLYWRGAPWQLNVNSLKGKLAWNLSDGHVLRIGQSARDVLGFSKLLNVLSFQSIMQSVSNSVSGESNKGFPFSSFEAMLTLQKGVAVLHRFTLDGPVAKVLVGGQVGLLKERYYLMITVRPYFTSSAPLIAGILGGPIVAAVAWAANEVVESAIGRIAAHHYKLTGSWKHPVVKEIKHRVWRNHE